MNEPLSLYAAPLEFLTLYHPRGKILPGWFVLYFSRINIDFRNFS